MQGRELIARFGLMVLVLLALSACAPAPPPTPTTAPAKPAPTAAQPAPTEKSAAKPTEKPAAKPTEKPAAKTDQIAEFYRGKTVRVIVGSNPGGGYDTYARAIARHLGKYIPGNPTVIVENMPGAGSLVAANHTFNVAPKDGTVVLHFLGSTIAQQLYGNKGVEFDAMKFQYLGAPVGDTAVLHVMKRAGITSLDQIIGPNAKELVVGGNAPGAMNVDAPTLLRDVLGAKIKIVSGFLGSADVRLAMERGEVDGFFNAWESTKITNLADVESGNWINLVQLTDKPHKDLPKVPTIPDVAKTQEQQQLLRFGYAVPGQFARPFVVPPGVSQDRVEALRTAFMKTLEDKDFLADAEKSKLSIDPLTGDQLSKLVQEYLTMPADLKSKLQKILVASS